MHIHPSSPNSEFNLLQSEDYAAVRIQAGFRGYRVRKQLQRTKATKTATTTPTANNNNNNNNNITTKRQRHTASAALQLQHQPEERIMSVPSETSSSAANKASINGAVPHTTATAAIEGGAAGNGTLEDRCATKIQAGVRGFLVRKKQKIATDAATKIQASFRGFKVRKEAQKLKQK